MLFTQNDFFMLHTLPLTFTTRYSRSHVISIAYVFLDLFVCLIYVDGHATEALHAVYQKCIQHIEMFLGDYASQGNTSNSIIP